MRPGLWTLSALGLLWGRAVASSDRATHRVYIACPLVSFLHIFILVHQIRPLQAHPMLEKLFGVYAGVIPQQFAVGFFLRKQSKGWGLVRHVSTMSAPCPRLVRIGFGRVSAIFPPCVCHLFVLCPPLSGSFLQLGVSAKCPPDVRSVCISLFLAWPRVSHMCPPCDRHVSALCPPHVRSCLPLCPRVSALRRPCVCHVSSLCPPCVHRVFALVRRCPLYVRH